MKMAPMRNLLKIFLKKQSNYRLNYYRTRFTENYIKGQLLEIDDESENKLRDPNLKFEEPMAAFKKEDMNVQNSQFFPYDIDQEAIFKENERDEFSESEYFELWREDDFMTPNFEDELIENPIETDYGMIQIHREFYAQYSYMQCEDIEVQVGDCYLVFSRSELDL